MDQQAPGDQLVNSGPDLIAEPEAPHGYRDYHVLRSIRDRLKETNQFDAVGLSGLPETYGISAALTKAVVVLPKDWDEIDERDNEDGVENTVRMRFVLVLMVRGGDPELRDDEIDRLLGVCKNAINGQTLAGQTEPGQTIPAWTKLRKGTWEEPKDGERRMIVLGETAYWIEGEDGHDEAG